MTQDTATRPARSREPLPGLITEEEAAELLNISRKTLQNMVYNGRIPANCYARAVTGKRHYYKDRLLGA